MANPTNNENFHEYYKVAEALLTECAFEITLLFIYFGYTRLRLLGFSINNHLFENFFPNLCLIITYLMIASVLVPKESLKINSI